MMIYVPLSLPFIVGLEMTLPSTIVKLLHVYIHIRIYSMYVCTYTVHTHIYTVDRENFGVKKARRIEF